MTATLTPEQRLGRADAELQELKDGFVDAISHLQEHPEVDGSFRERLETINERLGALRDSLRLEDLDKAQLFEFHGALWEINRLGGEEGSSSNLDVIDQLLVAIERVRHVIRDALDEHVVGLPTDAGLVVGELKKWLPGTSNEAIARLVGVDRRTLTRWTKERRNPPRRLQLVAHLVAILRHNWTEEGIVAWFDRPRRGLDGRKPSALLDDPAAEEALLSEARGGRSQDA
ncbi:MAG TPA: hypothetical protein VLK37_12260 [Solirubrobacterales bacterium]|nr:hypothetical protein [Solirubrobacterales bacterium]